MLWTRITLKLVFSKIKLEVLSLWRAPVTLDPPLLSSTHRLVTYHNHKLFSVMSHVDILLLTTTQFLGYFLSHALFLTEQG